MDSSKYIQNLIQNKIADYDNSQNLTVSEIRKIMKYSSELSDQQPETLQDAYNIIAEFSPQTQVFNNEEIKESPDIQEHLGFCAQQILQMKPDIEKPQIFVRYFNGDWKLTSGYDLINKLNHINKDKYKGDEPIFEIAITRTDLIPKVNHLPDFFELHEEAIRYYFAKKRMSTQNFDLKTILIRYYHDVIEPRYNSAKKSFTIPNLWSKIDKESWPEFADEDTFIRTVMDLPANGLGLWHISKDFETLENKQYFIDNYKPFYNLLPKSSSKYGFNIQSSRHCASASIKVIVNNILTHTQGKFIQKLSQVEIPELLTFISPELFERELTHVLFQANITHKSTTNELYKEITLFYGFKAVPFYKIYILINTLTFQNELNYPSTIVSLYQNHYIAFYGENQANIQTELDLYYEYLKQLAKTPCFYLQLTKSEKDIEYDITQFKDYNETILETKKIFKENVGYFTPAKSSCSSQQIYAMDFEAVANAKNPNHIPFVLAYVNLFNTEDQYVIYCNPYKENLEEKYIEIFRRMEGNSIIYFHNLTYDISFLTKYINGHVIKRNSQIIQAEISIQNKRFILKDSLAVIPMALSQFNTAFNLGEVRKIEDPYEFYNNFDYEKDYITDSHFGTDFDYEELYREAENNIRNTELATFAFKYPNYYNIYTYECYYCLQDCLTLAKGLIANNKAWAEAVNISPEEAPGFKNLTSSSFAKSAFHFPDGLKAHNGFTKQYIQKSVVGGRCQPASNKRNKQTSLTEKEYKDLIKNKSIKLTHELEKIYDYDAVSLYPSAMAKCRFPLGEPVYEEYSTPITPEELYRKYTEDTTTPFIELLNKNFNQLNGFIVCDVSNQTFKYDFPILCQKGWTNNDITNISIPLITLYDLITYQPEAVIKIKSSLIYPLSNGSFTMTEEILNFFNRRKEAKKTSKALADSLKLILNSCYGKTIQKHIYEGINIVPHERYFKQLSKSTIIPHLTIWSESTVEYRELKTKDEFIINQIGSQILAMSKHLMNRLQCPLYQQNKTILYQDTDSIHIKASDMDTLRNCYKDEYLKSKKYNHMAYEDFEDITGTELGQFHIDFEIPKTVPKEYENKVASYYFICVGKKMYKDILCYEKDNELILAGFHLRMKGIKNEEIKPEDYELLYNGETITYSFETFAKDKFHHIKTNILSRKIRATTIDASLQEEFVDDFIQELTLCENSKNIRKYVNKIMIRYDLSKEELKDYLNIESPLESKEESLLESFATTYPNTYKAIEQFNDYLDDFIIELTYNEDSDVETHVRNIMKKYDLTKQEIKEYLCCEENFATTYPNTYKFLNNETKNRNNIEATKTETTKNRNNIESDFN